MPAIMITSRPFHRPTIEQLRQVYRQRFPHVAANFVMREMSALHRALDGVDCGDLRWQLTRLLTPVLKPRTPIDDTRLRLDNAGELISKIARDNRRDIDIARACAAALSGIGHLAELHDIASGVVDPPPGKPRTAHCR